MRPVTASSLLLLASSLFGCSANVEHSPPPPSPAGGSAETGTPAPAQNQHLVLSGRYQSTDGPFAAITFYDDSHYVAIKRAGDPRDVTSFSHGTYTLDPAAQTLSLKDDLTGEVKTGPFKVTQSDKAPDGLAGGATTQALSPDSLMGGVGSLIAGVAMLIGGFMWLGSFIGDALGIGGGFNSGQFNCNAYGTMGPDGGYYSTVGLPNNPTMQLSTSRGLDGSRFLQINSLNGSASGAAFGHALPRPIYNSYSSYDGGYWSSLDPAMIAGLEGNMYFQDPSGPYAYHCMPY
jgi:hypothetical protein